jgi:hypothetical protein
MKKGKMLKLVVDISSIKIALLDGLKSIIIVPYAEEKFKEG